MTKLINHGVLACGMTLTVLFAQALDQKQITRASTALDDAAEGITVIPVSDLSRSMTFYKQLGCKVIDPPEDLPKGRLLSIPCRTSSVVMAGGGMKLTLVLTKGLTPSSHPIVAWRFKPRSRMGELTGIPGSQPLTAKSLPDGLEFFHDCQPLTNWYLMKDPDGNILALFESDSKR
jgi:hypothetical protein